MKGIYLKLVTLFLVVGAVGFAFEAVAGPEAVGMVTPWMAVGGFLVAGGLGLSWALGTKTG